MLLWHLCAALQDLLLQPHGDTECGPGNTGLLGHLDRAKFPTESPVHHLFLLLLCEFSAGAGQAMGWVSVFSP